MHSFRRWAAVTAAAAISAALSATPALAAAPRARVGTSPRLPQSMRITGRVPATQRVQLALGLTSRDPLGMARLATAVATPGSPRYHEYLSVGEFASRFGATPAHVRAVAQALRAAGLHVGHLDANHLLLPVTGTAAQVEDAFATRLASVRGADGRRAYAERGAPTLPATVAPDVTAVVGLNDVYRPQSDALSNATSRHADALRAPQSRPHVATGGPQPCAAAATAAANPKTGGYTADTIAAAYNFSGLFAQGDFGAGQTIAAYELEKIKPSDVAAYQACYGTAAPVSYKTVGHPHYTGDDEESALDVDQIIGLAPQAHVIVYQAGDTGVGQIREYARIMSDNVAKTVSVSWGGCEAKVTLGGSDLSLVRIENVLFQEAALQGQSILVASGDSGSTACFRENGSRKLTVQDPSSQPYVTAVGGTTLYATQPTGQPGLWNPAAVPAETPLQAVWNDGTVTLSTGKQAEATGGGLSALWSMPKYQRTASAGLGVINADSSGKPCGSSQCREVPDVSANGDPASGYVVYVSSGSRSGWTTVGGTSAAAPLWAALTADTNALPACGGLTLGFENPQLYGLAAVTPTDFTDITAASPISGRANNDALGTNNGLFPVTAGYDMTTGLGTPNAASLAASMCALRASARFTVTLAKPSRTIIRVGHRVKLKMRGADSGHLALSYLVTGLPRGLKMTKHGVIKGTARKRGTFKVKVLAGDRVGNSKTVSFKLKVLRKGARIARHRHSSRHHRHHSQTHNSGHHKHHAGHHRHRGHHKHSGHHKRGHHTHHRHHHRRHHHHHRHHR